MKILALRGENLASLQSRFEIDFSASRLGDAGLFAITGKTGSGKSTLLDAICLALYGGIPRLQAGKKNDAEIGRDDEDHRIKANDVRSILSRGKGAAFTEVDFVANDGTRWCAHWSVRRARGKAEGRIQFAEQWLENLDTAQRFAGKKQELQSEIQRLIGLSFEQFRRAVMLPQGEFAAFLKAGADERAALLERMTGGEIYSRLSVLAYARARTEKDAYQQLQARLGDVVLLTAEDKQLLHDQIGQLKQQSGKLGTQLSELKQHQTVLSTTEKMTERVMEAQRALETAQQQFDAAVPRQENLALLEKVQPARSDYSLLQQAQSGLLKLQQSFAASQAELPDKEQAMLESNAGVETAKQMLSERQQAWQLLEPDLRAALKLEQQREGMQQQLTSQQQEHQQLIQAIGGQEKALRLYQSEQEGLQQHKQELTEKLEQNQHNKTVVEQYASVRDNLAQYIAARETRAALQADKQQIAIEQRKHQKQQDDFAAQLGELQTAKAACEAQKAQTDLPALEQLHNIELGKYADKQQFRELLHEAISALKQWMSVLKQAEKSRLAQDQLQLTVDDMQRNLADLLPELKTLTTRYAECEQQVQKSRELMSLSDYRAELRPDQACPLCGALEHPYALDNPLAEGMLQSQQQRLKELAGELKTAEAQRSHLEQSLPKELERLAAYTEEATGFRQQISGIQQSYAVLFKSLGFEVLESDEALKEQTGKPVDIEGLETQLSHWEQEITEGRETLEVLQQANEQRAQEIKLARDLQDEWQQLQEQEAALNTLQHALAQQSTQWQERLQSLDQQYEVQEGLAQARSEALQLQFGDDAWQVSLESLGADAWFEQLEGMVQQYQRDQQALTEATQQGIALAPKIAATQKALEQSGSLRDDQALKIKTLQNQLESLQQQRQALVAEEDLARLEQQHQQAIIKAQQDVDTARAAHAKAGESFAALQAALNSMQQQENEAETNLLALKQRWLDWQQSLELDETRLTALLAKDELWLVEERNALKLIEQNVASGQARLKERQQDLQEQEGLAKVSRQWLADLQLTDHPGAQGAGTDHRDDNEEVVDKEASYRELASGWQQQKDQLDEQIFQHRQQLSSDEQARTKAGSLTEQLTEQQARYELWEKMNELIGSASGNKFRSLAQSLTLQQLVILANEHLQDLAPRYALQPVPGSGLALQVIDHDMGDEVRSVESLSGGESFLVSLALALALASLAADTRQLGSLFIDEGFGTLDPDSLEMALACLDALQADGRQIGVISHVGTLVERIGVQVKVEAMGGGRSRVVVE